LIDVFGRNREPRQARNWFERYLNADQLVQHPQPYIAFATAMALNNRLDAAMEVFKTLLPQAELFWIDQCGHAPMMEHPENFNSLLRNWLTKKSL
jgi:hypothetical protein